MKTSTYSFLLIAVAVFFGSCKKSGTDNTSTCNLISDFSIVQQAEALKLNISGSGSPLYYEASIQPAPGLPPGSTSTYIINAASATLSIDSLQLPSNQTYVCYVRAACSSSTQSEWIGPKSIVINNFCDKPYSLGVSAYPDGMGFDWQVKSNTNASSFQVQYGARGFALGSGTIATASNSPYTDASMAANTYYDFYVRSSCSGSLGFGNWAGPYTYLSTANQHLCLAPTNATYTIERNGLGQPVGANFQWSKNGETNFEYTVVTPSQPVTAGTVNSIGNFGWPTILGLFQDTDYHFYVRSVCLNGNRTSWTGPLLFNIGH